MPDINKWDVAKEENKIHLKKIKPGIMLLKVMLVAKKYFKLIVIVPSYK